MKTAIKGMTAAVAAVFIAAVPVCADSATVVSVKGKVEVSRNGAWIPLAENDTVEQGEIVSTGFKSEAVLKYQGSTMQLGPLTRLTLETLAKSEKKDTVAVYLNTGAVRSSVNKTENKRVNYTVHNPVAVASVRGTGFDFDGGGNIDCFAGAVVTYPASLYKPAAASASTPAAGESDAATPAEDIAPSAPAGAVVVLSGQAVTVTSDSGTSRPAERAAQAATAVQSTVSTPVNTESVTTGTSSSSTVTTVAPSSAQSTGKVIVNVKIQ